MLGAFGKLKGVIKLKRTNVVIDNAPFRLHYKLTFCILVGSCILSTMRQYFGEHIRCLQDDKAIPDNVLNNYCFISTTFSVPKTYGSRVGQESAYFGLGTYTDRDYIKHHAYYQWVPFVLFAQALMFYAPHALWKAWEDGKLDTIVQGLHTFHIREDTKRKEKENVLSDYVINRLHMQNLYALKFFVCELLNMVNAVGQIFFTDYFLGGEFTTYGIQVLRFLSMDPEVRFDPMARVFPKVTKCTFHKYGSSGTIQRHDAMCILSLNIVHEKIYTFLWFWFIVLAIITGFTFIYRVCTLIFSPIRVSVLASKTGRGARDDLEVFVQKAQYGDWFLMEMLSRNLDTMTFKEVVHEIGKKLSYGESSTSPHTENNSEDNAPVFR